MPILAVYFTNWSIYGREFKPSLVPAKSLTHIIYAFAKTNPQSGEVSLSDPWADIEKPMDLGGKGCLGEFQLLKKQQNPELRILLSIGGWTYSSDLTQAFSSKESMDEFVRSAAELVEKYHFDGLDVDWEYPETVEQGACFLELLRKLRDAIGPSKDLTIAVPASSRIIDILPLREMDRYLSFWNIMTYDFSGAWSAVTTHHANLYGGDVSVDSVISHYVNSGLDPARLVLGCPLYGRSFAHTNGPGQPFDGVLPGKFEAGMHDIKELPFPGDREVYDKKNGSCWYQGPDYWLSSDNLSTALQKADYARSRRLAGLMWWEASQDFAHPNSFVLAAADRFKSKDHCID